MSGFFNLGGDAGHLFMRTTKAGTVLGCAKCHEPIYTLLRDIPLGEPVGARDLRAADGHEVVDGEQATCPTHGPADIHAMVNP